MTDAKPKRVKMKPVMVVENDTTALNPFRFPTPPPGVVPDNGRVLAEDAAIQMAFDYAGQVYGPNGYMGSGAQWLGYPYLAELTQRPEYRRPSEILAKEMTREWVVLKSRGGDKAKDDKIQRLKDAMEKFGVQSLFSDACQMDGFFGRAQIYIDTGATDKPKELDKPLIVDPRKIPMGGLKGLKLVEPVWTYPGAWNADNPLQENYYRPSAWYVMGKTVHASRFLTFVQRQVPDLLKPAYSFGGLSLSQMAKPYVDNWLRTRQSVSDLVHAFSVMVLKTNLSATLEEGDDSSNMQTRAALFNVFRDNKGLMMIDKDSEDLDNVSVPLTGLSDLQAQSQEHMASVVGVPLVILLGITPSGLNASSDGEIRTFYAWIKAQQERFFTPNLRKIIDIIQLSEFGEIDPDIVFSWVPLWQLDEEGKARVRKSNADTTSIYIADGVVSPEEVREELSASGESGFDNVDLSGPPPEPPLDPALEADPFAEGDEPPQEGPPPPGAQDGPGWTLPTP